MNKNIKIVILTKLYKNYNYGGVLQAYALQKAIQNLGIQNEVLKYDEAQNSNLIYRNLVEQTFKQIFISGILKVI